MQKRKREVFVKMPNIIIRDVTLPYSAKRVFCALLSRSRGNSVKITVNRLSALSGCSAATVLSSISLLCEKGVLSKEKHAAYNHLLGGVVTASSSYTILISLEKDYTQIPPWAIQSDITHAAFALYCYIKMISGNSGKAFPSLTKMQRELQMAMSTVCSCIKQLGKTTLLNIMRCVSVVGDFACNTYQILRKFVSSSDNASLHTYRL